jgi:hypothetical protein
MLLLNFPASEHSLALPMKYLVKRPLLSVDPGVTVAQSAQTMHNASTGSVLVVDIPLGSIFAY